MPITAERMLNLIDIAEQSIQKTELAKQTLKYNTRDLGRLEKRLEEIKLKDEIIEDLIQSMKTQSHEAEFECILPAQLIQNLGFEKARFEINLSKNRHAKERMQMLRDGIRVKEFVARTKKKDKTETIQQDDLDFYFQRGQEQHPELGPCDGEPCKKCQEKETKITKTAEFEKENYTPSVYVDSEFINEIDDWLPETKKDD